MTRIESELHDLYECLMRNDDMADRDTYHTIVGIANDVAEVEAENAMLRELCKSMRCALADHEDKVYLAALDKTLIDAGFDMQKLGIEVKE